MSRKHTGLIISVEDILWDIQINVVFETPYSLVLCTEALQELLDTDCCTLRMDTVGIFDTLILDFTASY